MEEALAGRLGDLSHLGTSVSPPVKRQGEVKGDSACSSPHPRRGARILPRLRRGSRGHSDPHAEPVSACPGASAAPHRKATWVLPEAVTRRQPRPVSARTHRSSSGLGSAPALAPAAAQPTGPRLSAEPQPSPLAAGARGFRAPSRDPVAPARDPGHVSPRARQLPSCHEAPEPGATAPPGDLLLPLQGRALLRGPGTWGLGQLSAAGESL